MWQAGLIDGYQLPTGTIVVRDARFDEDAKPSGVALYARVSGAHHKADADRQLQRLRDFAAARGLRVSQEVVEFASGLDDKRPKLAKLLSDTAVGTIVIERKDRLTRFGYDFLEQVLATQGRKIEVINATETSDGLVDDFVNAITSMAAQLYGRRNSKNRAKALREYVEQIYKVEDTVE